MIAVELSCGCVRKITPKMPLARYEKVNRTVALTSSSKGKTFNVSASGHALSWLNIDSTNATMAIRVRHRITSAYIVTRPSTRSSAAVM